MNGRVEAHQPGWAAEEAEERGDAEMKISRRPPRGAKQMRWMEGGGGAAKKGEAQQRARAKISITACAAGW